MVEDMTQLMRNYRPNLRVISSLSAVTLDDVARETGVSKSTVSRALCDAPNVSTKTREIVREAAERLGYVPNDAARELAARRTVVVARMMAENAMAEAEMDAEEPQRRLG
jgi:DNA-binding LacI/PurR family transcriptional regulator